MRLISMLTVLVLAHTAVGYAQEKVRVFCDETDPANKCPGELCQCTPDTLEITFDGRSQSTLHAGDLEPGATIAVTVVMDTKARVRSWHYGVRHDRSVLDVVSATMEGTDAWLSLPNGFDATSVTKVEECVGDDPSCGRTRPGGGWVSAYVIAELAATPFELPMKRNSVAVASYRVLQRPGPQGTIIGFSERLKKTGSPPVPVEILTLGRFRRPAAVVDGFITSEAPSPAAPFLRGDTNGDGRINVTDGIGILLAVLSRDELPCEDALDTDDSGNIDFIDGLILLRFLFDRGPTGPIGTCGPDSTADLLGCTAGSCR